MAELLEKEVAHSTTAVSIPTTSETVVITSPLVKIPVSTCRVWVAGRCQLTSGTGTTAVTVRIRRGTTTAGTLIGAGISEAIKSAAGSTEPFALSVVDTLAGADAVQYVLTLQQAGATANGSVPQAAIDVEVLNG
jgi:hypothetical protein